MAKEATMFDLFKGLVDAYRADAVRAITTEEAYRVAQAKAFANSTGKTEALRKADADMETTALRLDRNVAALNADCALWLVRYAVGRECACDDKAVGE